MDANASESKEPHPASLDFKITRRTTTTIRENKLFLYFSVFQQLHKNNNNKIVKIVNLTYNIQETKNPNNMRGP